MIGEFLMVKSISSFDSLKQEIEKSGIKLKPVIEKVAHQDENIANNRLFVWNFEEVDLQEFIDYFKQYKISPISTASRHQLSAKLQHKVSSLMREGYNPIECMLFASKMINRMLENDHELQIIIAERIMDVYVKDCTETTKILNNIINMWTWVPQLKVIINAIGLIGDNEELLNRIYFEYADEDTLRVEVFHAFMHNKNAENLERAMKMVMNFKENSTDEMLGRVFTASVSSFGPVGKRIVDKYYGNPGISKAGQSIIKKIWIKVGDEADTPTTNRDYLNKLANNSKQDEQAYEEFLTECYTKMNQSVFYLCRFARPSVGKFLIESIKEGKISHYLTNTALISLATLGSNGYRPAEDFFIKYKGQPTQKYAIIIANILLNNKRYSDKLANTMSSKYDYELTELYGIMRGASIAKIPPATKLIQESLLTKFESLVVKKNMTELDMLASNLAIFWDKKLYRLIQIVY